MRIVLVLALAIGLGGCSWDLSKLHSIYTYATTETVPADVVRPAANAFDILKGTAVNFARYCISSNMQPDVCNVDNRRKISQFVNKGTKARVQMRSALATGQPILSTVYNILVDSVNGLKASPVGSFGG